MDIMPAFEAVVLGSNPGGSTKYRKSVQRFEMVVA